MFGYLLALMIIIRILEDSLVIGFYIFGKLASINVSPVVLTIGAFYTLDAGSTSTGLVAFEIIYSGSSPLSAIAMFLPNSFGS